MKVYVVLKQMVDDTAYVVGVFKNKKLANKMVDELYAEYHQWMSYWVTAVELNEEE